MVCKGNCCPGKFKRGPRAIFPEPWDCLNACCHKRFPPSNCFKTVVLTFQCGAACDETSFTSLQKAEVVGYYSPNPLSAQELPIFSYDKVYDKNFRFDIDSGSPSVPVSAIPCVEYVVLVTAIGPCCIEIANGTLYSAGNGKVVARSSLLQARAAASPPVTINGKRSPYKAKDGQALNVQLVLNNCTLQKIDSVGQDQGPCTGIGVKANNKTLLNDLNLKHRDKIKQRQLGLRNKI